MTNSNDISSRNEHLFKVLNHYGPVTSLKIYEKYVIVGYGSILKVFSIDGDDCTLLYDKQILKRNKIHGISIDDKTKNIAINGGRSFMILNLESLTKNNQSQSHIPKEKAINEWIISTEFLSENYLLILTSHNVVYKIDISSPIDEAKYTVAETIDCNEKSILYSGSIRILLSGTILVAAGTVMNGVILWNLEKREILYNFTEHEGSIFGVKVDHLGQYLISCSDDRSIKLYELATGRLLANGWGHGSRIWNLEFFKDMDSTSGKVKIFSTGEDCTSRLWQYHDNNDVLEQIELWENCHLGKHVWSGDVDDKFLKLCATGGADGRVRIHDLSTRGTTNSYLQNDLIEAAGLELTKNEIIKQLCALTNLNIIVSLTSTGNIIVLNQNNSKCESVTLDDEERDVLAGSGIMKSFTDANIVSICCHNGDILNLKFQSGASLPESKSWVKCNELNINKVINYMSYQNFEANKYYAFIDCPNPKTPYVLHTFELLDGKFHLKKTQKLLKPNQNVFTTTSLLVEGTNKWLILGSRYTSFAVYDLEGNANNDSIELESIFKKVCPGDTITSISIVETASDSVTLLFTIRDGVYIFLRITKDEEGKVKYSIIHQNKLTRGFVEGGFVKNQDLIVYGFKSSYFYVWNETKQLEIMNELCGGAHRKWEFVRFPERSGVNLDFKFIYLNKSNLQTNLFKGRFNNENYGLINEGTHGREIRDITISPFYNKDGTRLVISASEDTTIKLAKLDRDGKISGFWSMNNHVSGLQKVKFLSEKFIASSAANEEFIVWKLDNLDNNIPTIIEYQRLKPNNENPDLRIMDFDAIKVDDGFIISTVYSDSNIKIFHLNTNTKKIVDIADDFYTTCCILNVNFLKIEAKTFLMIGATDGHLSIWDVSFIKDKLHQDDASVICHKLGKMKIKQQLHQNGIKAVYVEPIENSYTIITGGDDNALILHSLTYQNDDLILELKSFIENAASATITSISKAGKSQVAITSVDQIVRLWSYENESLVCKCARYTTVADTGCSDSTTFEDINMLLIAGAGLSIWSV